MNYHGPLFHWIYNQGCFETNFFSIHFFLKTVLSLIKKKELFTLKQEDSLS